MSDSFGTDGDSYDKGSFVVGSSNKYGVGENYRIKMPESLMAHIQHLINLGIIREYRSWQDFARDAIFHRLHDVDEMVQDPSWLNRNERFLKRFQAQAFAAQRMVEHQEQQKFLETTKQLMTEEVLTRAEAQDVFKNFLAGFTLEDNAPSKVEAEYLQDKHGLIN